MLLCVVEHFLARNICKMFKRRLGDRVWKNGKGYEKKEYEDRDVND